MPDPTCPDDGATLTWTDWGYRCPECLVFVAIPKREPREWGPLDEVRFGA